MPASPENRSAPSLTLRPYAPEDLPAILDIGNRINWDAPPNTIEVVEHFYASRKRRGGIEQWVAAEQGVIVGDVVFWGLWEVEPAGTWLLSLEVDEASRNRGIGSRLSDVVMERVPALGIRRLLVKIREDRPDGLAFAEKHGFTRTGHIDRVSRLDIQATNLEVSEGIAEQFAREGMHIASLVELGPDNEPLLRAVHQLNEVTGRDIPTPVTTIDRPYEEWLERVRDAPAASFEWFWVALDGDRPVGLTRLHREPDEYVRNAFTGVDRAYRGRGIAQALKLRSILWARAHGVRYMFTDNAAENHAMLGINERLGYVQLPGTIEVEKEF